MHHAIIALPFHRGEEGKEKGGITITTPSWPLAESDAGGKFPALNVDMAFVYAILCTNVTAR